MTRPGEDEPLMDIADLPTDIDHLMSLNPLNLTPPAREAHLDAVIAYHRNLRAAKEAGMKVGGKRSRAKAEAKPEGAAPKIDLKALGIQPKGPLITRRV